MGRPLFSKTYTSPAVRTHPEPIVDPICHKWSIANKFDPDSDEFFASAQYEAFIDPATDIVAPAEVVEPAETDTSSEGSADSTETSGSTDAVSPMATGPDDPAVLIADAYPELSAEEWGQRLRESSSAASEWLDTIAVTTPLLSQTEESDITTGFAREETEDGTMARSYRPNRPRSASAAPALIPLSALLTQTRSSETRGEHVETPAPSTPRAIPTLAASPPLINTPAPAPDYPSSIQAVLPVGNGTPMTPQRRNVRGTSQAMFSPSPPPTVTPRFYSWQSHPIPAIPSSPTTHRGNRDGPLTNPHARRSFARLGPIVPAAPVMLSNAAN